MGTEIETDQSTDAANPLQESMPTGSERLAHLESVYLEGLESLGYTLLALEYSPTRDHRPDERLENLLANLNEFGAGDVASVHANFRNYVEGYAGASTPARYAIPHDDPTFQSFLKSSSALVALVDLASHQRFHQVKLSDDPASAVALTAKTWLELADRVVELGHQTHENGLELDRVEAEAETDRGREHEAYFR